jgi:hypothetical protein
MTTDAATLSRRLGRPHLRRRLRLERVVMGSAVVALIVLVVLPLLSLLFGSVKSEHGLRSIISARCSAAASTSLR